MREAHVEIAGEVVQLEVVVEPLGIEGVVDVLAELRIGVVIAVRCQARERDAGIDGRELVRRPARRDAALRRFCIVGTRGVGADVVDEARVLAAI